MIVNVPTSENLNNLALRLYFDAWERLLVLEYQFDEVFPPDDDWSNERKAYFEACQPELQSIYVIVQQSNELALKARLCEVSPFLLLLGSSPSFSTATKDVEFSGLRTVDSVDLPGAVNSLSSKPLSAEFITSYNRIRADRNQISHLGSTKSILSSKNLLQLLVFQYRELWPDRMWLRDRVSFAGKTTNAFFHDGRHASAHSVVMDELAQTFATLKGADFRALFGQPKSKRRYFCHSCIYEASTKYSGAHGSECKTAYLDEKDNFLLCIMCGEKTPVSRQKCLVEDCRGNVIALGGEYDGLCHSCGEAQVESD